MGNDELDYGLEDARWLWEEFARIQALHGELAYLYRTGSRDTRTIKILWELIEEGEMGLRVAGVKL
jgi:hypothetical protein